MRADLVAGVVCVVGSLVARHARAGNDDELLMGNHAAMSAGAVSATVSDASATWYNPAGLGAVRRAQVDVSGTAYTLRSYSAPRLLTTAEGDSDDGAVSGFVSVPTQIAYVRRLAERISLGLGYFVPHAENFVLREGFAPRGADDGLQVQLSLLVAEVQHTAAAALGFELAPGVRVGFGLIGGYGVSTQAVSQFSAVHRGGVTQALVERAGFITATRLSLEASLGLQLELGQGWQLGVSARTPRMQIYQNVAGSVSESRADRAQADPMLTLLAAGVEEKHDRMQFEMVRAGRAGLALAYRHANGWLAAELDAQPGLHRRQLEIAREPVVNARIGAYQLLSPQFALGFGLFTDRTSAPAELEPLSGSGDFYGATLGLEFSTEHMLAPGETVSSLVFSSVFALRYAFSDGDFSRLVIHAEDGSFDDRGAPGTLRVHELGLYVGSGLQF